MKVLASGKKQAVVGILAFVSLILFSTVIWVVATCFTTVTVDDPLSIVDDIPQAYLKDVRVYQTYNPREDIFSVNTGSSSSHTYESCWAFVNELEDPVVASDYQSYYAQTSAQDLASTVTIRCSYTLDQLLGTHVGLVSMADLLSGLWIKDQSPMPVAFGYHQYEVENYSVTPFTRAIHDVDFSEDDVLYAEIPVSILSTDVQESRWYVPLGIWVPQGTFDVKNSEYWASTPYTYKFNCTNSECFNAELAEIE